MPTILGFAALAIGGLVVARMVRREWQRVNRDMDETRSAKTTDARSEMPQLKRDPETGSYKPGEDSE